jgi:hypothetical protein
VTDRARIDSSSSPSMGRVGAMRPPLTRSYAAPPNMATHLRRSCRRLISRMMCWMWCTVARDVRLKARTSL